MKNGNRSRFLNPLKTKTLLPFSVLVLLAFLANFLSCSPKGAFQFRNDAKKGKSNSINVLNPNFKISVHHGTATILGKTEKYIRNKENFPDKTMEKYAAQGIDYTKIDMSKLIDYKKLQKNFDEDYYGVPLMWCQRKTTADSTRKAFLKRPTKPKLTNSDGEESKEEKPKKKSQKGKVKKEKSKKKVTLSLSKNKGGKSENQDNQTENGLSDTLETILNIDESGTRVRPVEKQEFCTIDDHDAYNFIMSYEQYALKVGSLKAAAGLLGADFSAKKSEMHKYKVWVTIKFRETRSLNDKKITDGEISKVHRGHIGIRVFEANEKFSEFSSGMKVGSSVTANLSLSEAMTKQTIHEKIHYAVIVGYEVKGDDVQKKNVRAMFEIKSQLGQTNDICLQTLYSFMEQYVSYPDEILHSINSWDGMTKSRLSAVVKANCIENPKSGKMKSCQAFKSTCQILKKDFGCTYLDLPHNPCYLASKIK